MRNVFLFFAFALALASCEKECEKDMTGTIVFSNPHQALSVTLFTGGESVEIAAKGTHSHIVQVCDPGVNCEGEAQISFTYQYEDREERQTVWTFPSVCGTERVTLDR